MRSPNISGSAPTTWRNTQALLAGLDYCVKKKLESIEIFADSQLMIRQLQGVYKVKHPSIIPLYQKAKEYLKFVKCEGFTHVPREENTARGPAFQ